MGLFKSAVPEVPATAIDLAGQDAVIEKHAVDPEKALETAQLENGSVEHAGHAAFDPNMEKRIVRKLDWNLVPLVMALYLLSFLDRSNIGNAKIAGMSTDLELTGSRYSWLLTIFYIAYIIGQFQIMGWKRFPPHIFGTYAILAWGIISAAQAAAQTWGGEMALRFLLGWFESAYGPGIPYLLTFFYLRHEVGTRMGVFLAAAPLATCFSGALAYGITSGHPALAKWRVLFLVEGLPTIAMAAVTFFYLPDSPQKARFLNEDEKRIAIARGVRQTGHSERVGGINWKDIGLTFLDPKPWFTALMYFSCNVSFSSLPVFLPTILEEMGFTSIDAQGLSAPPYFISWLVTIGTAYLADKTQQRGLVVIGCSVLGGIGYILLATTKTVAPRYLGSFFAAAGVFPAIANILPWVSNNQGSDTRRGAGLVILNLVGQCGPLLGTRVYPTTGAPFYIEGQSVCAAFMFFTAFLALGLRMLLVWENKKLDRKYGTLAEQKARAEGGGGGGGSVGEPQKVEVHAGVENYGPLYRYVL